VQENSELLKQDSEFRREIQGNSDLGLLLFDIWTNANGGTGSAFVSGAEYMNNRGIKRRRVTDNSEGTSVAGRGYVAVGNIGGTNVLNNSVYEGTGSTAVPVGLTDDISRYLIMGSRNRVSNGNGGSAVDITDALFGSPVVTSAPVPVTQSSQQPGFLGLLSAGTSNTTGNMIFGSQSQNADS
jgi:hypothetical protein